MKAVLHILLKDTRAMRWEIAASAALVLFTVMFELPGRHSTPMELGQFWSRPAALLALVLLVVRVVQSDALVGPEPGWLTRPLGRAHLVTAKALFVALFAVLPLAVRDSIIVLANGFPLTGYLPGLACSLAVWGGALLLPAAALAAVSRTLPQALLGALALSLLAALASHDSPEWAGPGWVPAAAAAGLAAGSAGLVLWLQYSRRATEVARAVGVAGVALTLGTAALMPWGVAWSVQKLFASETVETSRIAVRLGGSPARPGHAGRVPGGQVRLHLPVTAGGVPAGYRLRILRVVPDASADGEVLPESAPIHLPPDGAGAAWRVILEMGQQQFLARRESPARLRGRLYLAVLASKVQNESSFQGQRQLVPGVGACLVSLDRIAIFACESPFRRPGETRVTFEPNHAQGQSATAVLAQSGYSPFPYEFALAPLRGAAAQIIQPGAAGAAPLRPGARASFETWVPVAYLERDFDVTGRNLGEYLAP